jgi:hypothetical protein
VSISGYYKTMAEIEGRVTSRMADLRQAHIDVAQYCNGLAVDSNSVEVIYTSGLESLGIARRETAGMNAAEMRPLLKAVKNSWASHGAPAMAMDANESTGGPLDSILKGIPRPRDRSHRNDFRR